MKTSFQLEDIDRMEATLTMTLTISEWKKLKEVLNTGTTIGTEFSWVIRRMIERAEKHFSDNGKE